MAVSLYLIALAVIDRGALGILCRLAVDEADRDSRLSPHVEHFRVGLDVLGHDLFQARIERALFLLRLSLQLAPFDLALPKRPHERRGGNGAHSGVFEQEGIDLDRNRIEIRLDASRKRIAQARIVGVRRLLIEGAVSVENHVTHDLLCHLICPFVRAPSGAPFAYVGERRVSPCPASLSLHYHNGSLSHCNPSPHHLVFFLSRRPTNPTVTGLHVSGGFRPRVARL